MKVLLVASKAGYQTEAFAAAAKGLGIELDLATNRCHHLDDPWRDGALAVDFDRPVLEPQDWDGIVAVGDQASVVAAQLAEQFGLAFHPVDAVQACRSKFEMRERFRRAGMLTPEYVRLPTVGQALASAELQFFIGFPCVLKPIGLSASRGVIRANNRAEFDAALARIRRLLAQTPDLARDPQSAFIQIEKFIPGREFAVEGLVHQGRLEVLATFDKPDPLDGPFFEETIYVTPSRESAAVQDEILSATQRAVTALGLWQGPIHAECRVNAEGVWMLEVAGRPIGGLCARVLGSLEEVILSHALGRAPVREGPLPDGRGSVGAAVMMIPIPRAGVYQGVAGLDQARTLADVEITAVPGQQLVPLPEGASYLGFIFSRAAASPAEAEQQVRLAHGKLAFEIQTALRVV